MRREPYVHFLDGQESTEHQSGPNQQHERERHFQDNNSVAQYPAGETGRPAARAQHAHDVGTRRAQSRGNSECGHGAKTGQSRENQYGDIDLDGIETRHILRGDHEQLVNSEPGEAQTQHCSESRNCDSFRQHLPDQPPPTST